MPALVFRQTAEIPALIAGGNDTLTDVGDPFVYDGMAQDIVFEVANTGANLTKFAMLVKPHASSAGYHIIAETTAWDSVAGNIKEVVGTLKTLATGARGMAHVNVGPVYAVKFQASIASGARNAGVLTLTANPGDGETVTIGSKVYRFKTTMAQANDVQIDPDATPATGIFTAAANPTNTKASRTLTLTGQPADTQTVTLGATTYTFQTVLVDSANNVLIGGNASATIDNLIAAITAGAGVGTVYGTGTSANASATAAVGDGDTMVATALVGGTAGNSIASTDTADNTAWGGATLTGGTTETVTIGAKTYTFKTTLTTANDIALGISASATLDNLVAGINAGAGSGTAYGTGTTANLSATAAAGAGDTVDLTAITAGTAGNSVATTETCAQCSFGAVTLEGGTSGAVSDSIDSLIAAINGGEGAGTLYYTGTVAHTQVTAAAGSGDTMDVTAVDTISNAVGTLIATTETLANGSWGATTLADGITTAVTITCNAYAPSI